MKKKSNGATGDKKNSITSTAGLPAIHRALRAMVNNAEYDLTKLEQLQTKVDPTTADQIQVVIWDAIAKEWPKYELNPSTGEVLTKFRYAYSPLHRAIRFKGHELVAPVRIAVKNATVETIYNVIAPALLKAGVKPFLVLNDNTFLVLPKDKVKTRQVIARVG